MKNLPDWHGKNQPVVLLCGKVVDSGITLAEYEARVSALEAEGCDRSDAQGIVDLELIGNITIVPL